MRTEHEGRTWSIVLDLGNGALGSLQRHIKPYAVDAVLLSHLHVDHCIDLCGLYVMMRYVPGGGPGRPSWGPGGPASTSRTPTATSTLEDLLGVFEFHDLRDRDPFTVGPFTSRRAREHIRWRSTGGFGSRRPAACSPTPATPICATPSPTS